MIYTIPSYKLAEALNIQAIDIDFEKIAKLKTISISNHQNLTGSETHAISTIFQDNKEFLSHYYYLQLSESDTALVSYLGDTSVELEALVTLLQHQPDKKFKILSEHYFIQELNTSDFQTEEEPVLKDILDNPLSFEFVYHQINNNLFHSLKKDHAIKNLENYFANKSSTSIPTSEVEYYLTSPDINNYLKENKKERTDLIAFLISYATVKNNSLGRLLQKYYNYNIESFNKSDVRNILNNNSNYQSNNSNEDFHNHEFIHSVKLIYQEIMQSHLVKEDGVLLTVNDKRVLYYFYPLLPEENKFLNNTHLFVNAEEHELHKSNGRGKNYSQFISHDNAIKVMRSLEQVSTTSLLATAASRKYIEDIPSITNLLGKSEAVSVVIIHNIEQHWQNEFKKSRAPFLNEFSSINYKDPESIHDVKKALTTLLYFSKRTLEYEKEYQDQLHLMMEKIISDYLTQNPVENVSKAFTHQEVVDLIKSIYTNNDFSPTVFKAYFAQKCSIDNPEDIDLFKTLTSKRHTRISDIPIPFVFHQDIFPNIIKNSFQSHPNTQYVIDNQIFSEKFISQEELKKLFSKIGDNSVEVSLVKTNGHLYEALNSEQKKNLKVWKELLEKVVSKTNKDNFDILHFTHLLKKDLAILEQQQIYDLLTKHFSNYDNLLSKSLICLSESVIMKPKNLIALANIGNPSLTLNVLAHHNPNLLNMLSELTKNNQYNLSDNNEALSFIVEQYILEQATPTPKETSKKVKPIKF